MKKNNQHKILMILIFVFLLFIFNVKIPAIGIKIIFESGFEHQKLWVGERYKINIKKFPLNSDETIFLTSLYNKVIVLSKNDILMKSSGKECLKAYTEINKINSTICFNIYNTPDIILKENNPIKLETNNIKYLDLDTKDYPLLNIKYKSSHPDIIKIDNEGKITAIRPGSAIINVTGLDNLGIQIKVQSISNNGLINKDILDMYNAKKYKNIMIVAHPDDETLWGGANLFKDKYFVVCLTNGYKLSRANDFRKILKFTKNGGLIMDYPDLQDKIQDDWLNVENGILKDMSTIINYKRWDKIVTHGPDGTTGHYHHKKLCEFVTKIVKENNKYENLYYFGKFYRKNETIKNLPRISEKELKYKKREVSIYKSVKKTIYRIWFHSLPYENWIPAIKWKE